MQVDVPTLYYLIVATTATAAALTFWERRSNAAHRIELGLWSLGYVLISVGCLLRISRPGLPDLAAIGVSNVAVCGGYGAIAWGTLRFIGRRTHRKAWMSCFLVLSAAWLLWGIDLSLANRIAVTSGPVAFVSLWIAAALLHRPDGQNLLPSQSLAAVLFAFHGGFFAFRIALLGLSDETEAALWTGNVMLTIFEGILWSVAAPMTLLVLVREKTERQLLEASQIDYLTGLDNRRGLFRKAERIFAQPKGGEPAVLVIFDLDHFKSINDRHGHQTGDRVLELFSRVAEVEMRPQDVLARLGGEEFAALFPSTDPERARRIAARLCKRFAQEVCRPDGLAITATVSAGMADTRTGPETLDGLMDAADRALYRAKELGRNRIEQASLPQAVAA